MIDLMSCLGVSRHVRVCEVMTFCLFDGFCWFDRMQYVVKLITASRRNLLRFKMFR
jgi:hypothetical protein